MLKGTLMAFVEKLVGPDENLVGVAKLHWIYIIKGLMWLIGSVIIGGTIQTIFAIYIPPFSLFGNFIFGMALILGALMFVLYFGKMIFTELGLTTERLIYKRGFLFVDVREVDLEEIKSESINNGVLGRVLNYGYLDLDARFIEDMDLPAIADPYRFVKAMNAVRSQIKNDNMRVVLDDGAPAVKGEVDELSDHNQHRRKMRKEDPRGAKIASKLEDDMFEAIPNSAEKNMKQMKEEVKSPDVFKKAKPAKSSKSKQSIKNQPQSNQPPQLQDNPKQRKKDLSEKVMDDFETEAEPEDSKNA